MGGGESVAGSLESFVLRTKQFWVLLPLIYIFIQANGVRYRLEGGVWIMVYSGANIFLKSTGGNARVHFAF